MVTVAVSIAVIVAGLLMGALGQECVDVQPCSSADRSQLFPSALLSGEWQTIGEDFADTSDMCLTASSCIIEPPTANIYLLPCGQTECPGGADQLWKFDVATGYLVTNVTSPQSAQWCATLQAVTGPAINLWPCIAAADNTQWNANPVGSGSVQLSTREARANFWCLTRQGPPSGGVSIVANASAMSLQYDGMGGLAAVGGARLLFEYPEPLRSAILDLMFKPSGGAAMQILKTEQQGDMDSSYGSGPSYAHTRGDSDINRGIYLPWLIQEAKKRRPDIVLYTLSWGAPFWVGNGSYYSQDGIDYHLGYLQAARSELGVTFDYAGIWNESPWERAYIKNLRSALDAAGFNRTQIVMPDGADSGCSDCPPSWGAGAASALNMDPELAKAVAVLGLHTSDPEGVEFSTASSLPRGIRFWNSENNVVDGPQPQFDPIPGQPYGSGLGWPRVMITNYVRGGATATILCPIMHSWSWNLGRENHGFAQVTQPWSGAAELGSAFWSQAHFTQLTEVGWQFVDGGGSGELCDSDSGPRIRLAEQRKEGGSTGLVQCDLVWATLAPPDQSEVTIVAVNSGPDPIQLNLRFTGLLLAAAREARALAVWQTNETEYFAAQPSLAAPTAAGDSINITIPARAVLSVSTVKTASRVAFDSPKRAAVPLPLTRTFDDQAEGEPGASLSDIFGAFTVADDATASGSNRVLWQGAVADPQGNCWHGSGNGAPATTVYAGTNFANVNVSADLLLQPPAGSNASTAVDAFVGRVCGRLPVWKPFGFKSTQTALGVCAVVAVSPSSGSATLTIQQTNYSSSTSLGSVTLPSVHSPSVWLTVRLSLVGDRAVAQAGLRGASLTAVQAEGVAMLSGVAAVGFGWHTGYVDNLTVEEAVRDTAPPAGSFLFEVLAGQMYASVDGWAGMVLNMSQAEQNVSVVRLGRFIAPGNTREHNLTIFDATSGANLLPGALASVDAGSCSQDYMGFCYSAAFPAVTLEKGGVYYVVAGESADGDATVAMTNPCRGTTHANRDGTTLMTYAGPGMGEVTGRVSQSQDGSWQVVSGLDGMDTSYGPVNFVMAA